MLPVTPHPLRGPGYWGSPYARPITVNMHKHPKGFTVPKGVWMIRCGHSNSASLFWRAGDDFSDEPRRAPGTGLLHAQRSKQHRRPPPWTPTCGTLSNSLRTDELVERGRTGVVFADGFSVLICGHGEAIIIRVFG